MSHFEKVLIANRGEIACRVARGCRAMGLATVAVYSDADAGMPHVRAADEAVRIGPAPASESYLDGSRILAAAQRTGAQAIHPGYGFLSENAGFVRAVEAAGLVFVGPRAASIEAMGDKAAARALMEARGVPVVPGYSGADQNDARFVAAAEAIGYPVLVKASAGGGGKGMSIVRSAGALPAALAGARRLAASAFGDDRLILERYVSGPRHVEVQILGDTQGNVRHCFERECSVQRRFQKIIEEAPSPAVDEALRARLCEAAVTAGRAIDYVGAGTVEFILGDDGAFYFLEVNTRLQVEHPVTELITGLDLVQWQLRVALGEALPEQAEITRSGHAFECRLYAEDPAQDFLPSTGTVFGWRPPAGVRVDAGIEVGSEIGIHYDPMLAKLVTHGPSRAVSRARMLGALRALHVAGPRTNRAFLIDVMRHPAFAAGALTTHFLADHCPDWQPATVEMTHHAIAAALVDVAPPAVMPGLRPGWRNNRFRDTRVDFDRCTVHYRPEGRGFVARVDEGAPVRVERDGEALVFDGWRRTFVISRLGDRVAVSDPSGQVELVRLPRFPEADDDAAAGGCVAPMPGKVVDVLVAVGDAVAAGASLVVIEAMKMEQTLTAPHAGTVTAVAVAGALVDAGQVLVEIDSGEEA